MSQSLSAVYLHLVFSTKNRSPFLTDPDQRESLHQQVGGISNTLSCPVIRVGGTSDHIHILGSMSRTITLADWIKELKRVSTNWFNQQFPARGKGMRFSWQGGYAAFSVSQSNVPEVTSYIENQLTHHQKMTFQDEMRALYHRHNVEFDERYAWD